MRGEGKRQQANQRLPASVRRRGGGDGRGEGEGGWGPEPEEKGVAYAPVRCIWVEDTFRCDAGLHGMVAVLYSTSTLGTLQRLAHTQALLSGVSTEHIR